jgi:hypothetical protein
VRVPNCPATSIAPHQTFNSSAVAGHFDDDLIILLKCLRKLQQTLALKLNLQFLYHLAAVQDGHLSKRPVNIHADDPHRISSIGIREPAGLHDIYGFALAAQPGKS